MKIRRLVGWTLFIIRIILFNWSSLFLASLFILSYWHRFDPQGILMLIFGGIIAYIGYKNTGFILRREEVVDRWAILIENGKGRAEEVLKDTEGFIRE